MKCIIMFMKICLGTSKLLKKEENKFHKENKDIIIRMDSSFKPKSLLAENLRNLHKEVINSEEYKFKCKQLYEKSMEKLYFKYH